MEPDKKGFLSRVSDFLTHDIQSQSLNVRTGSTDSAGGDSPLPGVVPPTRSLCEPMSVEAALTMSAVYRAVDILSTSIQQLELGVYIGADEMDQTAAIIRRPDINSSPSKFLKKTAISLATSGNAYWKVTRESPTSAVSNLEVLNPHSVSINHDRGGNKEYLVGDKTYKPWQIKHLKLMDVFGSDYGLGPIQAAKNELRGSLQLRDYASNWFTAGSVPTGVLSSKDYMDEDMAAEYRRRWDENQANHGVAVLGNGMAYEPILLSPADAQFLENQAFNTTLVARLFGIPANYLLADAGNSLTYQNMIQVDTAFVKYTLTGYLREIEEAFTDLMPKKQRARFKLEGFLRADEKTRADVAKVYVDMGVLSPEEVRIKEGWGPMPEGLKASPQPASEGIDTSD